MELIFGAEITLHWETVRSLIRACYTDENRCDLGFTWLVGARHKSSLQAARRGQRHGDPWATRTSPTWSPGLWGTRTDGKGEKPGSRGESTPHPRLVQVNRAWPLGLEVRLWHLVFCLPAWRLRASGWALLTLGETLPACPVWAWQHRDRGPHAGREAQGWTQGSGWVQLPQVPASSQSLSGLNQRTEIQQDQGSLMKSLLLRAWVRPPVPG